MAELLTEERQMVVPRMAELLTEEQQMVVPRMAELPTEEQQMVTKMAYHGIQSCIRPAIPKSSRWAPAHPMVRLPNFQIPDKSWI
jgi:hypothetical protein